MTYNAKEILIFYPNTSPKAFKMADIYCTISENFLNEYYLWSVSVFIQSGLFNSELQINFTAQHYQRSAL